MRKPRPTTLRRSGRDLSGAQIQEHGFFDMHIWLDLSNAQAMVDAIVAALSDLTPERLKLSGPRLAVRERLEQLDQTLSASWQRSPIGPSSRSMMLTSTWRSVMD